MTQQDSSICMVGLGVMGKSLTLNLIDNGYSVVGFDRNAENIAKTHREARTLDNLTGFVPAHSFQALVAQSKSPRIVFLSVPAGHIVDDVVQALIQAELTNEDIVIDTGNSLWTDSCSREVRYSGKVKFFTTAVSGGEQGARFGPSLMPSGDKQVWEFVRPILQSISAKCSDSVTLNVNSNVSPCCEYIGPVGSGHYVKMVHNGIEYADMQLVCEAYQLMKDGMGLTTNEIADTFEQWSHTTLSSYLLEISADILRQNDPKSGQPFVDMVLDTAQQKGTGLWTAVNSLELGCPAPSLSEAVFARAISARKPLRASFQKNYLKQKLKSPERSLTVQTLGDALLCAKIAIYAQGFDLIRTAALEQNWDLNFAGIANIWRAGCIIRAEILRLISNVYNQDPVLENLMLASDIKKLIEAREVRWRKTIGFAIESAIPTPVLTSSLNYFDSMCCSVLPANLLQAQRDYFGAHGYQRVDETESKTFHLTWELENRQEVEIP
ncbi:NADP-dependent phosphogluconate dehydrogenase [Vibrio nigripulchritudo]|uniref:NADP-dependent phosphogluconate dehydrogenase n=1 Tax=Vibrio nigripulchritudo TaxID=28173 RepID=UPI00248F7C83|nr:NADP-dependent phosphogluconate dehydrogenase [Vibrio nigripulchritudo]BDU39982.1 6-phosphogluconate dehydrogenase, decarboxylating [Vibrio nigripulchritudo]BDU45706.1 6-phosphogluconate dehydrogenase, decarboxylating [Vibrio nigripulchritudo]